MNVKGQPSDTQFMSCYVINFFERQERRFWKSGTSAMRKVGMCSRASWLTQKAPGETHSIDLDQVSTDRWQIPLCAKIARRTRQVP
jgi:hypothetical protein